MKIIVNININGLGLL
ncbi:hypothetical protein D050_4836A, partial [Vibrio parahaemolyticus VPCR-2009]